MLDQNNTPPAQAIIACGRLAPSPTGYMHLGNAWAFLAAWLGSRSAGGRLLLRMEDIDPQRSKKIYEDALIEDLAWLGLDWDAAPDGGPYRQSERLDTYKAALDKLALNGSAYPCFCTRKELRSLAGAPQGDELFEPVYPGFCRELSLAERQARMGDGRAFSWRMRFPADKARAFSRIDDLILGTQTIPDNQLGGDFALCRSDGVYAYQLAVVLDDIGMGVNQVIRGEDILGSTPRQMYLYSVFGAEAPQYGHLPLLLDQHGERLAKRHASLSVRGLREAGVKAESIIGWLAAWSGLRLRIEPASAVELLDGFDFKHIRNRVERLSENIVQDLLRLGG